MAYYRLVSFKSCPWVQRVAIVLREKEIEFEFQHIEPTERPEWFKHISPHNKVPILRVGEEVSLFESDAINEYLDELHQPKLHPDDPVQRSINRAWIEYAPTFADIASGHAYADNANNYERAAALIPSAFEKVERILEVQGSRPFFNGTDYSLVDAAYAPFLQRHLFLERIKRLGHIDRFPRLRAWAQAIVDRQSTHSFPPDEYEAMYRDMVKRRNRWMSQFVTPIEHYS